jgi:hypothetical protein
VNSWFPFWINFEPVLEHASRHRPTRGPNLRRRRFEVLALLFGEFTNVRGCSGAGIEPPGDDFLAGEFAEVDR